MGSMFGPTPKPATPPNPPTAPKGSAQSSANSSADNMLAAQSAASLQGGTVMAGKSGSSGTTTKTLLGQ